MAIPQTICMLANMIPKNIGENVTPNTRKIVPNSTNALCPSTKKCTPRTTKYTPRKKRMNNFPKFSASKFIVVTMSQEVKKNFYQYEQNEACLLTKYQ